MSGHYKHDRLTTWVCCSGRHDAPVGGDMWAVGLVGDSGPRGEVGVEGGDIMEFVLALRGVPEI